LFSLPRNYGFQRASDVKIAKTGAVTVRLDPELKRRLAQAAAKLLSGRAGFRLDAGGAAHRSPPYRYAKVGAGHEEK